MKKKTPINKKEEYYSDSGEPMIRPDLHLPYVAATILFYLLVDAAVCLFVMRVVDCFKLTGYVSTSSMKFYILLYMTGLFIIVLTKIRHILIFFIRIYQRYAPYETRDLCCYTPSCSEYMALAIQKYGAIKGVKMGVERLKRCEPPGGIDYP